MVKKIRRSHSRDVGTYLSRTLAGKSTKRVASRLRKYKAKH